jgi:copper chaperone
MTTITYSIPNISCEHCVHTIQTELLELDGIKEAHANVETKDVVIAFDFPATEEKIKKLLTEINYPVAG